VRWSGWRNIPIEIQRTSMGATTASPVSGFAYEEGEDLLIVSLLDGTLHEIGSISTDPAVNAGNGGKVDDISPTQLFPHF
jgi:hypothetical protein